MPTYNDEGIILRRINYGEADRILTILTREHGKIGVIARGVRKPKSKLASHTDLFSRSQMQLAKGRGELDVLAQAQAAVVMPPSGDALAMAGAAVCAELADRVLEGNHPNSATYEMVASALQSCLTGSRDSQLTVIWFAQRMIERMGYAPQLQTCVACGDLLPEDEAEFYAAVGGLICVKCRHGGGIRCSVSTIKVMRTIAGGDEDLFWRLRLDAETREQLEDVVEAELAHHLDRRLRSFAVFRSLRG